MPKKIIITYYASDVIPNIWFNSEVDAENYDKVLNDYTENHKEDWLKAESLYPSYKAIYLAIERNEFQEYLNDDLVLAIENSIDEDYSATLLYIFFKIHPELIKYTF